MMIVCMLLFTIALLNVNVSAYHCIVTEDDIPSPFNDNYCIQKVNKLISKQRAFSIEIAWSNEHLLSEINQIAINTKRGEFKNEGAMMRGIGSFVNAALDKGTAAMLTTALSHCAWNIVDNLSMDKWFDATEWSLDFIACGSNFDWKEMMTQTVLWGTSSGVINGGIAAAKQMKTVKWTYSPHKVKSIAIKK